MCVCVCMYIYKYCLLVIFLFRYISRNSLLLRLFFTKIENNSLIIANTKLISEVFLSNVIIKHIVGYINGLRNLQQKHAIIQPIAPILIVILF